MARITVEDCLTTENNRFALVQLSAKRTKQLLSGARVLLSEQRGNKAVVTSLREIAAGQVRFMTEEEKLAREAARKKALAEAAAAREAARSVSAALPTLPPEAPSTEAAPASGEEERVSETNGTSH